MCFMELCEPEKRFLWVNNLLANAKKSAMKKIFILHFEVLRNQLK